METHLNQRLKSLLGVMLTGSIYFAYPEAKALNFMTYMCNNNNLHHYAVANFKQMIKVGSSPTTNLLIQMDAFGVNEIMRFYIEKNNPIIADSNNNTPTPTSFSGSAANLYDFITWGTKQFPSERICLSISNHGSGIKDPDMWGKFIMHWRDNLFVFNRKTGRLELNRHYKNEQKYKDYLENMTKERGIAFNDSAAVYLSNEDLKNALESYGKKFDVLMLDACFMAMVEVASQVKNAASFMVASQEAEPGSGHNYTTITEKLSKTPMNNREMACHIVSCYADEYSNIVGDYTQSAIDLSCAQEMEAHINKLALDLTALMKNGNDATIKAVREIRFNPILTTEFLDNDYVDLKHLLESLIIKGTAHSSNNSEFSMLEKPDAPELWLNVVHSAQNAHATLQNMVVANARSESLNNVGGLSIYFPTLTIDSSYSKTVFAQSTAWPQFLEAFLEAKAGKRSIQETPKKKACCDDCGKHENKPKTQRPPCPCKKNKKKKAQERKQNIMNQRRQGLKK